MYMDMTHKVNLDLGRPTAFVASKGPVFDVDVELIFSNEAFRTCCC